MENSFTIDEALKRRGVIAEAEWRLLISEIPQLLQEKADIDGMVNLEVFYFESEDTIAYASSDAIYVSLGLIRSAFAIEDKLLNLDALPKATDGRPVRLLICRSIVLWNLLHEYNHIVLRHHKWLEEVPSRKILEFDSDIFASLNSYQILREVTLKVKIFGTEQEFRAAFVVSIFWLIRREIDLAPASSNTHPSWQARLFNILRQIERESNARVEGVSLIPRLSQFMLKSFDVIRDLDNFYLSDMGGEGKCGAFVMSLIEQSFEGSEYYILVAKHSLFNWERGSELR